MNGKDYEYMSLDELDWDKIVSWFNKTCEEQLNNTQWVLIDKPKQSIEMATLEERVEKLEEAVFGVTPEVSFIKRNTLYMTDRNILAFPHAQVWWNPGTQDYNLYIRRQVQPGANIWESLTGSKLGNLVPAVPASLPAYSTVINSPKGLFATKHTWLGNPSMPYGQFYKYQNGAWNLLKQDTQPTGEDRGVFWCEEYGEFIMYCRRHPYTERKLAVYASSDFVDWRMVKSDLYPHRIDGNSRFYSAGGFILGSTLFAVTNVIDYDDWTVTPYLHIATSEGSYYRNGVADFTTYHLTEEFPEIDGAHIQQLFVYPHVVNNKVVFTCIKCLEPHERPNNPTGIHWTEVWDMPIDDFTRKVRA